MALWWMEPGWTQTTCAGCGKTIWPEGDPDWGYCYECFSAMHEQSEPEPVPLCGICGKGKAVTDSHGIGVCSEACHKAACLAAEIKEG